MGYVEVYSDEILEATSLGKIAADFDISKGDYIKIPRLIDKEILLADVTNESNLNVPN